MPCRHEHLTCALWQIAAGALGTDILKVVEAQPALLLQRASPLDDEVRMWLALKSFWAALAARMEDRGPADFAIPRLPSTESLPDPLLSGL